MKPRGFIALITAIVLSAILLLIAAAGSMTGFYTRTNVLDAELKERSSAAAESCVEVAILGLALDEGYVGPESITLNALDSCTVDEVIPLIASTVEILVEGTSKRAVTTLRVEYSIVQEKIVSWREIHP